MKKTEGEVIASEETKEIQATDEENICFVISPIGKEGTDTYEKFKETLDYVVKPAIISSGYKLRVIRANDIKRAGSFIKDILEYVATSFVVIADLTNQNPNVFYELGVRHSLSPRTILIAQSLDDIPSDLREYRTIIYDTTAKGASLFTKCLTKFLEEMFSEPTRPDNPVLDRLGSIIETKTADLKAENDSLRSQISNLLSKGPQTAKVKDAPPSIRTRMQRVIKLHNAIEQDDIFTHGSFVRTVKGEKQSINLETHQGSFRLYFKETVDTIDDFWYIAIIETPVDIEEELADIRVLLESCSHKGTECTFIIAINDDLSQQAESIQKMFKKMKDTAGIPEALYDLLIWDKVGLLEEEKKLGIKVELRLIGEKEIKADFARAGQEIDLGRGTVIEILNPQDPLLTGTDSDLDNNAIILRLSKGEVSFLLTADLMREGELELIYQRANLESTVLKVAHHGSATSTTPELLSVVRPQFAVISVGAANTYGHPTDEIITRLTEQLGSASIYRTDEDGTIEFITNGEGLWVRVGS